MRFSLKLVKILLLVFIATPVIALTSTAQKQLPQDGLIVIPSDETYGPARNLFTNILDGAENKIDLSMYQLKDQGMIDALMRAAKRGIKIRIVTEKNPYQHSYNQDKNNLGGTQQLMQVGVPIQGLAPRFLENNPKAQAHHKILIVDDTYAIVMSCNWDTPTLANTRDFAMIISKDKNPKDFQEINHIFESDWHNEPADYKSESLIIGPDHQREKFINLFSKAKHTIEIYQQSYNDEKIAKALEEISRKGIKIKLLMMPFPFGGKEDGNSSFQNRLIEAGGEVRLVTTRYIHAKVVIIDGKMAYIGSCNFYPTSLDFNRELGVITQDSSALKRLKNVFEQDWENAEPKSCQFKFL